MSTPYTVQNYTECENPSCRFSLQRQHFILYIYLLSFSPSSEISSVSYSNYPKRKKKNTMAIFRSKSSFLTIIFAVVAVIVSTVINPPVAAYGQEVDDVESVVVVDVVYDDPLKCRPAVDDYTTCESTGVTWNTKSYCLDTETYDNVLGCCPPDQIGAWNTTVITCRHGAIGWPQIPNSNNYVTPPSTTTSTEDADVDDIDIGNDSTASAASSTSSSSLLLSTATGIAISLVVVVIGGHYY